MDKTVEPTETNQTTKCKENKITAGNEETDNGGSKAKASEGGERGTPEQREVCVSQKVWGRQVRPGA